MNETQVKNFQNGKTLALWLGGAVYVGVVLLFLSFYETLMTGQFEGLLKTVARVGAFLVAANAIALPVALHYWTVTKWHKFAAILFYSGDILLMGFNVLAATMNDNPPAWVAVYSGYAPASIVFVLFGWALLYMTDPAQRALIALSEAMTDAQVTIVKRTAEHAKSDAGTQNIIEPFAAKLAARIFNERSLTGTARALEVTQTPQDAPNADKAYSDMVSQIAARVAADMRRDGVTILDTSHQVTPNNGGMVSPVTPSAEVEYQPVPFRSNGHGK